MFLIRRFVRRTVRLFMLSVAVALVVGWFLVLRPTSLGGPAGYAMVSGPSMQPTFETGDLVITQRQAGYGVGDIVLFRVKRALVIHRIVGGDGAAGYLVRGDHNSVEDGFRPTIDAVEGKAWLVLPGVGTAIEVIRRPLPLAICTWGIASFILLRRWGRPRPAPAQGS
jgi:signal peptidase